MTSENNITQKVDSLENEILEYSSMQEQIKNVWYEGSKEFLNEVFKDVMTPNIKLAGGGDYWRFFLKEDGGFKEFLAINFSYVSFRDEDADEIRTSVYGTTTGHDSELDRLILLGKFAAIIKENKLDILNSWNEQKRIVDGKLKPTYKIHNELSKELKELKSKLKEQQFEETHKRAKTEGITFDKETTMWLTQDSNVRRVTHFQIIGASKSGLTVDLMITYNNHKNEPKTYERKKVRWSNITQYIK